MWSHIANKVFGNRTCYGTVVTMEYFTYMGLWNRTYTLWAMSVLAEPGGSIAQRWEKKNNIQHF
jgi:hypothetical protein